jgi:hypothetical protein
LPFDFFIFALNLDLAIKVSTVFAKLPIAIAISRIPQTTTCDRIKELIIQIKYYRILVALTTKKYNGILVALTAKSLTCHSGTTPV